LRISESRAPGKEPGGDRPGGLLGGQVHRQDKAALFGKIIDPWCDFVAGISGRDVSPSDYVKMVDKAEIEIEEGNKEGFEIYGVRG
jgi:hypothetical protein